MATAEQFKQMEDVITLLLEQITQLNMQLAAMSTTERKFSKRFEVVADPGHYEGDRAKFTKWWTKIKVWMKANWDGLETNRDTACVVEIEGVFHPQTEKDWAQALLQNFTQGMLWVDEYTTKFLSLFRMAGMSDKHRVFLLERNLNPKIIKHMYLTGKRTTTVTQVAGVIQEIGRAQGLYDLQFSRNQGGTWSNNAAPKGSSLSGQTRGGKVYGSCQKKDCCSGQKGKGWQVQQTELKQQSAPPQAKALKGMDYEAMKAYFYNLHMTELKAQGEGFSH
ncbi:hypothetical protein BS17DRAFT_767605 [Gyrodon lividus]|nr:hypothetical protein BS17DRAFT_767605 [Gyrodon lividus]